MRLPLRISALLVPGLILVACGSSTDTATSPTPTPTIASPTPSQAAVTPSPSAAAQAAAVSTGSADVGGAPTTVLVDTAGMTLYYRTDDGPTTIKCSGGCAGTWVPLTLASGTPTSAKPVPGPLSTLTGPNGRQVLYNGHPLYRFAGDGAPGQARGQGAAGIWFAVTPNLAAAH